MASMIDNDFSDDSEEMSDSSDVALQEAFARGELKPGLVVLGKKGEKSEEKKRPVINNVPVLLAKFEEIKLPSDLNWVERLDIVNDLAPLAPEIAFQLDDHKEKREKEIKLLNARKLKKKTNVAPTIKSIDDDLIHNDFKREMTFYRQAQEAIMKCLPRLKSMKVPTRRPEDYFAEMAKSDNQMQKVAQVLLKKQTATEKAEKVRKIRDQKKFSKQTQVHVLQERQKAKKELNENIKKYRKGQKNTLDFLDEAKGIKKSERGAALGRARGDDEKPRVNKKRLMKDEKYGYGGPKKGTKWNTKESLDNFEAEIHSRGGSRGRGTTRGRGSSRGRGISRDSSGGRGGSRERGDSSSRGRGGGSRGRGGFRGGMSRGDSRGGGRDFSGGRGGRGGRGDSRGGGRDFSGGRGGRGGRGDSRGGGRDFSGGRGGRGGGGRGGGRRDFSGDRGGGGRGRGGSRGRGGNRPGKDARNNLRAGIKR